MKKASLVLIYLILAIPCQARTITVDDDGIADFNNIQAAINDSNDGDIIEVQPGTYIGPGNRDIDFLGKAITVRSIDPNDPNIVAATIIDCNGTQAEPHRGFYFHSGEDQNSVVEGLSIVNGTTGFYGSGGGIYCRDHSSPTISKCTISSNMATYGGGIRCSNSSPTIVKCTISDNIANQGGGMNIVGSNAIINNCTIRDNTAGDGGGGIYCASGNSLTISNCIFTGNSASYGGGIYSHNSNNCIVNCIMWADMTQRTIGAEISVDWYQSESIMTVSYSDVEGGQAGVKVDNESTLNWGPGNIDTDPRFVDPAANDYHLSSRSPCINAGDPAYSPEPGETDIDGEPRVINGRIDIGPDEVNYEGPLIYIFPRKFEFCAEKGGSNPEPQIMRICNVGSDVLNWEITGNCPWLEIDISSGSSTGEADNVTLSVDIAGLMRGRYNCQLTVSDPCALNSPQIVDVNLITEQPVIGLSAREYIFITYEGGPNPTDQILSICNSGEGTLDWQITDDCAWLEIDPNSGSSMGEANEVTLGVDITGLAGGSHNCELTISDPKAQNSPLMVDVNLRVYVISINEGELHVPAQYPTIQTAIDDCNDGDIVIVAPDSYSGDGNRDIDFGGKAIVVRSIYPNDPAVVAATVIDCNGSEAEPHRGFSFHSGEGPNSIVSGFTVKNGYVYDANGGAIYCSGSSPTIENCIIIDNKSQGKHGELLSSDPLGHVGKSSYGGAICCTLNSNPTIINCTIRNNPVVGGDSVGSEFSPTVGKGGDGYGGGICCTLNSSPTIVGCTISNNRASGGEGADGTLGWDPGPGGGAYGGGIYCDSNSSATIDNCDITNNKASAGNGGYDIWGYGGNGGEGSGGGICCDTDSRASINNCTISSNEVIGGQAGTGGTRGGAGGNASGSGIYLGPATAIIKNCLVTGNQGTGGAGGNGGGLSLGMGGAGGSGRGGGICCDDNSQSIIENCSISNNTTSGGDGGLGHEDSGGAGGDGYGGGIFAGSTSESTIENCAIAGNTVSGGNGGPGNVPFGSGGNGGDGYGGGIFGGSASESAIENCTIAGNTASGGNGGSGGTNGSNGNDYGAGVCYGTTSMATITNSIIWSNDGDAIYGGEPNVTYSDVKGSWFGEGNIDADPCFADPCNGDYHLQSAAGRWEPNSQNWVQDDVNSPCIDAGDPNSDWTAELWPHGKQINMGAYGGTPQASMSLSDAGNVADLNNDDSVDYKDLMWFTDDWLCEQVLLSEDLDRNGIVNFIDFAIFANNWP